MATLTNYFAVYADANYYKQALNIFNEFKTFNIKPTTQTYRVLVRMHIRQKDIDKAIEAKNEMNALKLRPDFEIHGMLIESFTHRNMIVEALKELEEATANGLKVSEKHLRQLRNRCNKLGVKHPDMPADPHQWIKDLKQVRRDTRHSSNREIQRVQSALFGK